MQTSIEFLAKGSVVKGREHFYFKTDEELIFQILNDLDIQSSQTILAKFTLYYQNNQLLPALTEIVKEKGLPTLSTDREIIQSMREYLKEYPLDLPKLHGIDPKQFKNLLKGG